MDRASLKFGRVAIPDEPIGTDRLKTMLTNAAANATATFGPTFFFEEGIDIFPQGSQTAAAAAASVAPLSNGDPVTAKPKSALELDDTTMVTTISGTDAYPANPAKTQFAITVAILAQVIDQDVLIAEGPGYRRVTTSKGLAPSPGPESPSAAVEGAAVVAVPDPARTTTAAHHRRASGERDARCRSTSCSPKLRKVTRLKGLTTDSPDAV